MNGQLQGWVLRDFAGVGETSHGPWLVFHRGPGGQGPSHGQHQDRTLESPPLRQTLPVPTHCCKENTLQSPLFGIAFFFVLDNKFNLQMCKGDSSGMVETGDEDVALLSQLKRSNPEKFKK